MSDATTFYSMYSLFFLSRFLLRLFREIQFRSLEAFFRSQGHLLIGRRQVSIYRLEPLGSKSLSKIHSHLPFLAFNYWCYLFGEWNKKATKKSRFVSTAPQKQASKSVRPFCSMDREPRHLSRFLWPGNCSENGYGIIDCCGITIEINIEARNNMRHSKRKSLISNYWLGLQIGK